MPRWPMTCAVAAVLVASLAWPQRAGASNDGFAGTAYTFYPLPGDSSSRPLLPLMHAAGSRWDRFDFPWPQIELTPGQWAWATHDALVNDVRQARMNILGILLWTPPWASTGPCVAVQQYQVRPSILRLYAPPPSTQSALSTPCATRPPQGLYEPWNDWTTTDGDPVNYWGRFAYQLATRYRGAVRHWEVWNEPDLVWFWSGSPSEYARLLKVAHQAIKAACPECTVLFGGLAFYAAPSFYTDVLNVIRNDPEAPAHGYFFDALGLHLYSRSSSIADVANTVRAKLSELIPVERAIWLTETGVPVWDDLTVNPAAAPYIWSARQHEAAAFTLQSYANARLAGIQRYIFFRAHDDWCDKNRNGTCADDGSYAGMQEMYGLARDNLTLRPAYTAYQLATQYLISPTWVSYWNYTDGGRRVSFWGTPRGKVSVFWNTSPTTTAVGYPIAVPSATLITQEGQFQTVTPTAGVYTLTLPGATANNGLSSTDYIIGGRTFLLVEHDTDAPTAQLLDVRPANATAFTVTWTGADPTSGVWRYDVQQRPQSDAAWTSWLTRTGATVAVFNAPQPSVRCFRARAWDRVGQISEWTPERCAAPLINVRLNVLAVFGDANTNGAQDVDESPVLSLLRLRDSTGADVVSPTVTVPWLLSTTLPLGEYRLEVWPEQVSWLPELRTLSFTWSAPNVDLTIGLRPRRNDVFIPTVLR